MRSALILVENGYEELELWVPYYRFLEDRLTVQLVGPQAGTIYTGKHGLAARADIAFADARLDDARILLIPGGWAPDRLRVHEAAVALVSRAVGRDLVVAAICHGGSVLVSADVVRGEARDVHAVDPRRPACRRRGLGRRACRGRRAPRHVQDSGGSALLLASDPRCSASMSGRLFVVSLPIGNLRDITLRAIDTLRTVDVILAEDTRTTQRVLHHYGIRTPFYSSLYEGAEDGRTRDVVELLRSGKDVALVSDAGTPLISDPGFPVVRAAVAAGIQVVP